jgi:hypothetical protein
LCKQLAENEQWKDPFLCLPFVYCSNQAIHWNWREKTGSQKNVICQFVKTD